MASKGAGVWLFNTAKCNNDQHDSGSAVGPKETGILCFQTCGRESLTLEERERESETIGNWEGQSRKKRRIWEKKPGREKFRGDSDEKGK